MLYRKNKLGEELELPIFNHYYNISITALEFYLKNPGQSDTYIITFKQDNNLFIVDMTPVTLMPPLYLQKTSSYQVSQLYP